jgi:hypothetical protein
MNTDVKNVKRIKRRRYILKWDPIALYAIEL